MNILLKILLVKEKLPDNTGKSPSILNCTGSIKDKYEANVIITLEGKMLKDRNGLAREDRPEWWDNVEEMIFNQIKLKDQKSAKIIVIRNAEYKSLLEPITWENIPILKCNFVGTWNNADLILTEHGEILRNGFNTEKKSKYRSIYAE